MLAVLGTLLAGAIHPASAETIVWTGNGTSNGVCSNIGDFDDLDPEPGEQGWLFILTSPDPGPWTLTATFNPGGVVMESGVQQGNGSIHFVVYSPAGATLQSASATNGSEMSVLTVSHCEVNEEEPENPTLVIDKLCIGDADADFSFDISPDEDIPFDTFGCGENSGTINLDSGQSYSVTELTPLDEGWTGPVVDCTGVDASSIDDGVSFTAPETGAITCTFTNTFTAPENPTLVINKVCIGDADADFSFDISPDEDMPFDTFGCGENSGTIILDADTEYDVTELTPLDEGWTGPVVDCTGVDASSIDDGVSFTAPETGAITCTFTNTFTGPENPTLVINKVCIGDADTDFSFDISPDEDMPFDTFGCGENSGTIILDADTEYDVTELTPLADNWSFGGASCTGIDESTIANGVTFTPTGSESIVCNFTNVFQAPENPVLIVFKDCIGGSGEDFDFTLDGDGITAQPTLGCGENSGIINLDAGNTYELTEDTPLASDWTLTGVSCTGVDESSITNGVSFVAGEGDIILCTFTNTFSGVTVQGTPVTPVQPPAALVETPTTTPTAQPPAALVETPTTTPIAQPPAALVETPAATSTPQPPAGPVSEVGGAQVVPPSTGSAGLADEGGRVPRFYVILAGITATLGAVSIFWVRAQK
jgi:hypothetical protein